MNKKNIQKVVEHSLKDCRQKGLVDAVVKGGNELVLHVAHLKEPPPYMSIVHEVNAAPCITAPVEYLAPEMRYKHDIKFIVTTLTPYSHPHIWFSFKTCFYYNDPCSENTFVKWIVFGY